ncbi:MAG: shikimate dehydrogenase [Syntrophaceae bacterium]|nr:shikimate dehydrogenase [Syntrophaceae bacterium]
MIDARTELYGIIGNPVRHSLSPLFHNRAFRRMGLNALYLAFEVRDLQEALTGIRALGIRGVSVTIPFKTQAVQFLDEVEEVAAKIRAVNTILNRGGMMIGYNTDWHGAIEALEERVDLRGKRVLLLGAGGAGRAIGFGLREKGAQVIIANRSAEKADELAEELGFVSQPWSSISKLEPDVIINATSIGMYPYDTESPLPKEILREGMTVMDIVYRPLRTRLLRDAEERGCLTIDGLEMLARQGAGQLEIWTGKRPDLGKIKEDLYQGLVGKTVNKE